MSAGVRRRWVFFFAHRARVVEVGPFETEEEARVDFERVYGVRPGDAVIAVVWAPGGAS